MHLVFRLLGLFSLVIALGWFSATAKVPKRLATQPTEPAPSVSPLTVSSLTAMPEQVVTDFTPIPAEAARWRNIDDTVMGGISQGEMLVSEQGTGVFRGTLSLENNGGFSSVRRDASDHDFSAVNRISARVKGDGRRYQLRLQTRDADRITYRAAFETVANEWQTVTVALEDFEPVFRGRVVASAPLLNTEEMSTDGIYEVGFLIADGKSGEFRLEVDWIKVE
ncbi:MAG: CIA30 family protein [Cyanobacteria bacterium P01_D01_bin.105]